MSFHFAGEGVGRAHVHLGWELENSLFQKLEQKEEGPWWQWSHLRVLREPRGREYQYGFTEHVSVLGKPQEAASEGGNPRKEVLLGKPR